MALFQPAVFDLAGVGKGAYCSWFKLCVQGQRESVVGVGSELASETESGTLALCHFKGILPIYKTEAKSFCFPLLPSQFLWEKKKKTKTIRKTPKLVHDTLLTRSYVTMLHLRLLKT